ncbi:MAG: cyclic nucleotide-binding domain-containing protein, partial [Chloroflexota bacterium]|nr:cyclic nucleotide-binding domain-containing protein [Chloroflexota bacterium]
MVTLEKLYEQPLLDVLAEEELEEILPLIHSKTYEANEVVFRQGEEARNFYLVARGEFEVFFEKRRITLLYPGEFFGDIALLYGEPRGTTVRAIEESEVLYVTKDDFLWFVERFPSLALQLDVQGRKIQERADRTFPGKGENEVVLYFSRRHWMALAVRLVGKVGTLLFIWFLAMVVALVLFQDNMELQGTIAYYGVLFLLIPLAVAGWEILDWYNDYFIVTNERVIHIEQVASLRQERYEVPLAKIQNVNVVRRTPLAEMLHYATVNITTAAQSTPGASLSLDYMPHASHIADRIIRETNKERGALKRRGKEEVRRALRTALGVEPPSQIETGEDAKPSQKHQNREGGTSSSIRTVIGNTLSYLKPVMRIEEDNSIIWRKHWILLLRDSLLPWLVLSVILFFIAVELFFGLTSLAAQTLLLLAVASVLLTALWLWWIYEDWRNDLYILTPETIVDQEQRPFGFNKEVRRASLDMIQDTRYVQPNPLMVCFDVGNVLIQTAGQEGLFTFNWVKDPRAIQHDIFRYIQARQAERERNEAARISQELFEYLKIYNEEKPQSHPTPPHP